MRHRFTTLADLLEYTTTLNRNRLASDFVDGGCSYTFSQFRDKADQLSGLLGTFGLNPADKVAILSENMPNWAVAFFAITAHGRIAVPMLPDLSPNEVENILVHSEAKAVFVSQKQLPKISKESYNRLNIIIDISTFDLIKAEDESYTCDGRSKVPDATDIAAIIYTSGTTGNAKGVIEMSIGMLYPFSTGCPVYYIQKPPTPTILSQALLKIRPTTILSVPLIIEKVIRGKIFPTIAGSKYLRYLKKHFPHVLYFLVGKKVKQQFGGRVRFFGIGGSKLDREVEEFLRNIKFPYAIGYGLTETAPLICDAGPKRTHLGTTGTASYEVQVRLADVNPETGQGELQVKGPNVMLGYYKDYARTRAVMTDDGWMRTGDIATMDKKGRYSILGRSGSVIIGASGENIYPEEIESVINKISDVNESLVISRAGQLVALVQFNDGAVDWNLEGQEKFLENIEKRKKEVMEFVNSKVSHFLKIKDVEVMKEPFNKTATHKIRRFLYQDKNEKRAKGDSPQLHEK